MKLFLSGRYESREILQEYASVLMDHGYEVPCKWLELDQMDFSGMDSIPTIPGEVYAWNDYFDVKECDVFVAFTEKLDGPRTRGGRHVEYGFAYTFGKPIIIVGPNETVFHSVVAEDIWRMPEWNEDLMLQYLEQIDDFLYMTKPRRR